jgi:predicted nucleotidyltransferase
MNSQPENFFPYERLLVALVRSGVDFAVVGGVAVSLNGFVRATEDVDIIVNPAPENLRKLIECLQQWGEGWARELKSEDFTIEAGAIRLIEDFALDMFVAMREKMLDDFRPRLRHLETGGVRIPYLAPEDLIFLKQDSWRDKDKLDVQAMREIIAREART